MIFIGGEEVKGEEGEDEEVEKEDEGAEDRGSRCPAKRAAGVPEAGGGPGAAPAASRHGLARCAREVPHQRHQERLQQ